MSWNNIWENIDMFKEMIQCTHLPFKDWMFYDKKRRKRMMDEICKCWEVIKLDIEKEFGTMDHPKSLYIYGVPD